MNNLEDTNAEEQYWALRYEESRTGWDIGSPSTPLKTYIDQIEDKNKRILIPGAGNAYEAEYLHQEGFKEVYILDIAQAPLDAFHQRVPDFPKEHLLQANFFSHESQYDLIFEQTFFCSFPPLPENRSRYAKQMASLLSAQGKLVGLWFTFPLTGEMTKRPFGGTKEEYLGYLDPYFKTISFEPSYNSIEPRQGNELFGIFQKK